MTVDSPKCFPTLRSLRPATSSGRRRQHGVVLPDAGSLEIGPQIQRPNGTLVAFGGIPHTSIYTFATGTWTPGPDFPNSNDSADGPASLLPDGTILLPASPGVFQGDVTCLSSTGSPSPKPRTTASSLSLQSWQTRTLVLPTGQVMYLVADGGLRTSKFYTSTGRPNNAWRPKIRTVAATVTRGSTFQIRGSAVQRSYRRHRLRRRRPERDELPDRPPDEQRDPARLLRPHP